MITDRESLFRALHFKWNDMNLPLQVPDKRRALFRVHKLFPELIFDIVHLEGNPHTFPEVQTLLEGITVGGHKLSDAYQILNQQAAMELMKKMAQANTFSLTKDTFCAFHTLAAKNDASLAGAFRARGMGLAGTEWKPPSAMVLDQIFSAGIAELSKLSNPLEKGIAFFLFGVRNQFFLDGNMRNSMLMMNSILLEAGQDIITIPAKRSDEFNAQMVTFHSSGAATDTMHFLVQQQITHRF